MKVRESFLQIKIFYAFFLSFHDRANTPYIVKYNLQTERVEAQISVGGYTARKNGYSWSSYNGMDLEVDEHGLWVLWGSTGNNKRLSASKIDVYNNAIIHTYTLSTGKPTVLIMRKINSGRMKQ